MSVVDEYIHNFRISKIILEDLYNLYPDLDESGLLKQISIKYWYNEGREEFMKKYDKRIWSFRSMKAAKQTLNNDENIINQFAFLKNRIKNCINEDDFINFQKYLSKKSNTILVKIKDKEEDKIYYLFTNEIHKFCDLHKIDQNVFILSRKDDFRKQMEICKSQMDEIKRDEIDINKYMSKIGNEFPRLCQFCSNTTNRRFNKNGLFCHQKAKHLEELKFFIIS